MRVKSTTALLSKKHMHFSARFGILQDMKKHVEILVALPMAYQDGVSKFNGIARYLTKAKLDWILHLERTSLSASTVNAALADGISGIIADTNAAPPEARKAIAAADVPVVLFESSDQTPFAQRRSRLTIVNTDSDEIGRRAADYLHEQGAYASYAYVPETSDADWSRIRGEAFVRTLSAHGIGVKFYDPPLNARKYDFATCAHLYQWLRALPKPVAVFAARDERARLVIEVCQERGLRVPGDVVVLGVDNEEVIALHTRPPLSSIQTNSEQSGYLAAEAMDKHLKGLNTARNIMVPLKQIVGRESTAPSSSTGKLVVRAMEIIRNEACELESVVALAKRLHVSRRLLDLRFREIQGRSVLDALIDVRLEHVRALLTSTTLSIEEITSLCKFRTQTYLKRLFKARYGLTMRDYRRA